ncbi:hypothetical protein GIB67_037493 [Kingdonia uniflora]|uniref:Protein kinase domain-containing protein n=1 Tax=Kingdonia uniflora TaxID=39325 RepID=A0A7J7KX86_9MAGN|nr:hypothetical protein GIB67_037493 [Kingdonia uniflora]
MGCCNIIMVEELLSLLVFTATLAFLTHAALAIGSQYETCKPRDCGNGLTMSYPFWIPQQQESYCGHPDFNVTCSKDNEPILRMSNDDYIIRNIFYKNQSLLVTNTGALSDICPMHLHNLTFVDTLFKFSPNHANLFFFYNCTLTPTDYFPYQIPCASNISSNSGYSFATFMHEGGLQYLNISSKQCESFVVNAREVAVDVGSRRTTLSVFVMMGLILRAAITFPPAISAVKEVINGGFHVKYEESVKSECVDPCINKGRGCVYNTEGFTCQSRSKKLGRNVAIAVGSAAGFCVFLLIISLSIYRRRKTSSNNSVFFWKSSKQAQKVEDFLSKCGFLAPKRYTYFDIKKMTNSFEDKLGQGGFGGVFKGKLPDGRLVAVKLMRESKGDGEDFINEVASISRTSHVNVVSLLGFCFDDSKRALIYEFMPNGSLEKFIYKDRPLGPSSNLSWEKLYEIVIGIGRGLEYLHRGCNTRIVHFDIKPNNILLDKDFCPKISDFGLAKLCTTKESVISMLGTRGTPGYIAPEVFCRTMGGVSHKSDVYSYGMMVLETVGGRRNIKTEVDHSSEIFFPHWIHKRLELDQDLGLPGVTLETDTVVKKMILVGLWCIQTNPIDRPSMNKVVEMLEGSLESLRIPPKTFLTSPSRSE